ncbi:MAG: 16S rRNA (guanine(966)-N(2))-methyltransferase RsmD [Thermodesulfobacteriota bacterium]
MRIISGNCKGRKLAKMHGSKIRPTSDRVREAVFNILGPRIKKAKVLDLFAGTGALGIEALSRGAAHATFIDLSCDIIHENLQLCGLTNKALVICCDIIRDNIPKNLNETPFDYIFMDPPYGNKFLEHIFHNDPFFNLLEKNCIIIAEQYYKEDLDLKETGLDIYRQKKYSKTIISFITATGSLK